jgi:hypothetical protein
MNRWWIYQKERFPLLAHGPLVLAFSASAVSFSSLLRGADQASPVLSYAVAFVVSLASFMLLRIADEFKDAEEDARYRPYRPVPRGLVKLRELALVGGALGLLQLGCAVGLGLHARPETGSFGLRLVGLLVLTWVYFALMSREFFARAWLKARPVVYLFSHMGIMPLVDWFATGCDWAARGEPMPKGLFWFLAASFCNGLVIELGRKIRSPEQEEHGVETYTALWGRPVAVLAWLAALLATFGCAVLAAQRIHFSGTVALVLGLLLLAATVLAAAFLKTLSGKLAKTFEAAAGVWTLGLYLTLGIVPLVLRN